MSGVVVEAPGKVNLFLRVLARERSGYHGLETLFCAVALSDRLRLERRPSAGLELAVEGRWELGSPSENLVTRAHEAFRRRAGVGEDAGVTVRLEKRIPPGSGLGGGSSDAAATLRGLNRLHGMPLREHELVQIAAGLGSDVPFFLSPSPLALGWSRGERLLALPPLPVARVVLALPGLQVSSAGAYRRLARRRQEEEVRRPEASILSPDDLGSWRGVSELAVNDFEPVVLQGRPRMRAALAHLREAGAGPALLSGSGSALFGVFGTPERAAEVGEALARDAGKMEVRTTRTLEEWPALRPVP